MKYRIIEAYHITTYELRKDKLYKWSLPRNFAVSVGDIVMVKAKRDLVPVLVVAIHEVSQQVSLGHNKVHSVLFKKKVIEKMAFDGYMPTVNKKQASIYIPIKPFESV